MKVSGKASLGMGSILVEELLSPMTFFVVSHPRSGKVILGSWSKSPRIFLSERNSCVTSRCAAGECLRERSFLVEIMKSRWTFCKQSILCDTEPHIHLYERSRIQASLYAHMIPGEPSARRDLLADASVSPRPLSEYWQLCYNLFVG